MRILYLHQYFKTPGMAGGTRSYEMARRLAARGHEVHVITARDAPGPESWIRTREAGVDVHWCRVPYSNRMSYPRRIRAFLKFSWLAARKAASIRADVLFATSTPLTIALPAVYAARRQRIPMVFEVRDLWPELPVAVGALRSRPAIAAARWLERFAYRNARHVVALSPGMKQGVVAAGCPARKVSVIPNACDLELFRVDEQVGRTFRGRHDWLGDRPLVVYAGTLGIINGVDYLARLAAAVQRRDAGVRFLVIGSGHEEERVRRTAGRLGVLDRSFYLWSPLPKREMPAVLSAADVAVSVFRNLPAMANNSANKVFDALAAGRPVAVNYGGWQAEIIRQTGCGLVLDAEDVEGSAGRLVSAVRDPAWLARARAAARRVAEEQFDRNRSFDRFESVLVDTMYQEAKRRAA
jgi:glycosyltransferase involved in cell wall biosynthesis